VTDGCHLYLPLLYLEVPQLLEVGNASRVKGTVATDRLLISANRFMCQFS
jgi:hypothetical protein